MKKIFHLAAIMFAAIFASCASDGNTPEPSPTPGEATESWTVMFYSVGGGNLDTAQVNNLSQAFEADQYNNINMTVQLKFSKKTENKPWTGAGRFDMAAQRANVGTIGDDKFDWIRKVQPSIIGGESYDMSTAEALADFINWSKEQHPAKHYMLILSDHGSGYDILADNGITAKASADDDSEEGRLNAILADDNVDKKELSLINIIKGIQSAMGETKLDVIYPDACLMSTVENLCGYQQVANYFIGAEELTPGPGGDYTKMLNLIGKNSTDTWTWATQYVDHLTSSAHWDHSKEGNADAGVYNLQSQNFQAAITNLSTFGRYLGDDLTAGGTAAEAVNEAVRTSQVAQDITSDEYKIEWGGSEKTMREIQQEYESNPTEFIATINEFSAETQKSLGNIPDAACYGITAAEFMGRMADSEAVTASRYKDVRDAYIANLKQCAHLSNNFGKDPYTYTSMSVNVFGMTDAALAGNTAAMWVKDGKIWNNWSKYGEGSPNAYSPSQLKQLYSTTAFEQAAKWAENFLTKLTINPGAFFNPSSETNTK